MLCFCEAAEHSDGVYVLCTDTCTVYTFCSNVYTIPQLSRLARGGHPQVSLQCWFFLSYLLDAAAVAASGLVAERLGRGRPAAARRAARRCWAYAAAVSVVCGAVIGLAPGSVAAIFTDSRCAWLYHTAFTTLRLPISRPCKHSRYAPLNSLTYLVGGGFYGDGCYLPACGSVRSHAQ
jgi:MatE